MASSTAADLLKKGTADVERENSNAYISGPQFSYDPLGVVLTAEVKASMFSTLESSNTRYISL